MKFPVTVYRGYHKIHTSEMCAVRLGHAPRQITMDKDELALCEKHNLICNRCAWGLIKAARDHADSIINNATEDSPVTATEKKSHSNPSSSKDQHEEFDSAPLQQRDSYPNLAEKEQ